MDDRSYIMAVEARLRRMETIMQELLTTLAGPGSEQQKNERIQNMLQESNFPPGAYSVSMSEFSQQASPELRAIQQAFQAGNKIKAIKLYREYYNVGLREAKEAIDNMQRL